jgi:hypothetical protein
VEIILDPPVGVAQPDSGASLLVGMPFDQAIEAARAIPGFIESSENGGGPGFVNYVSEMSISIGVDRDRNVQSIEIYRPMVDFDVLYNGISIFGSPAEDVIQLLSARTTLELEDGGLQATAPELFMALSRNTLPEGPDDEDGRYFESVLVAAPGYYG